MSGRWIWKGATAALAVALCGLAIAACGGGSSGSAEAEPASPDEARLAFAECMRDHGIDVPDPQPGQPGMVIQKRKGEQGGLAGELDSPAGEEAREACEDELGEFGPGNLSAEEKGEFEEAALAYAQCMREHGIDMPDPQVDGGKVLMQVGKGGGVEPDAPAFREAEQACRTKLPEPPGS